MNREDFKQELETLINRFSLENGSDTPDFILASYLWDCLNAFNHAVSWREDVNGRKSNVLIKCPVLSTVDEDEEKYREAIYNATEQEKCKCETKKPMYENEPNFCSGCGRQIINI